LVCILLFFPACVRSAPEGPSVRSTFIEPTKLL
jgi:hypothetical protein